MALNLKNLDSGNSFQYEALEDGGYAARVVGIVDLGLHTPQVFDKSQNAYVEDTSKKPVPFVYIQYELSHEFLKDENGEELEDKPRWLGERFALYPTKIEQAKSTKRIKAIDPKNQADEDLTKVLGFPCSLLVKKKGDKNKIGDVAPILKMKGYEQPELVNPTFLVTLDDTDTTAFDKLPDWLKKEITSSLNFEGSNLCRAINGSGGVSTAKTTEEDIDTSVDVDVDEDDGEGNPW